MANKRNLKKVSFYSSSNSNEMRQKEATPAAVARMSKTSKMTLF